MFDLYIGLALFCFIASVTPGPNNIILIVASNRVGTLRAMPVLLGICFGFSVMITCSSFVISYLKQNIYLHYALSTVSLLFLFYICYGIFRININDKLVDTKAKTKEFNFINAALFQFVNPKAWIICSAAAATYIKQDMQQTIVFITALIMSILGCIPWLILGSHLDRILNSPLKKSLFFKIMSLTLLITVIYSYF